MSAGFDTYRKFVRPLDDVDVQRILEPLFVVTGCGSGSGFRIHRILHAFTHQQIVPAPSRSAIIPCLVRRLSV